MSTIPHQLSARPHGTKRLVAATAGPLLLGVGLVSVAVRGNPWGLVFVLAGLYLVSDLWRGVVVADGRLTARGRISTRGFDVRDLQQVAVSTTGVVWVHPSSGPPFYLRMLAESTNGTNPGIHDFPDRLRAVAVAAGARPEPAPEDTLVPPEGIRPVFSW